MVEGGETAKDRRERILSEAAGQQTTPSPRRLDTLWDSSITLLAIADPRGIFLAINPAWTDLLGWSESELQSRPYVEFVHPDDRDATMKATAALAQGEEIRSFDNRYRCKDESYLWLRWDAVVGPDGLIYATARDISQEEKLESARAQLANNIAHDLANAVTPLKINLATIKATDEVLPKEAAKALTGIAKAAKRLEHLIRDTKDAQLAIDGHLSINPCQASLVQILQDVHEDYAPIAPQEDISFTVDVPDEAPVVADAQRMHQVVTNLVRNAFKFTPAGGRIHMDCKAQDSKWRVEVQDTGRGLTSSEQDRLFQPFTQVHDPSETKERGTGLGLYIARSIIEGHDGSIGVTSPGRGAGSTFWFELPRNGRR